MNETEILIKVKVFSDPEYCNSIKISCPYLQFQYGFLDWCLKYKKEIAQRSAGSKILLKLPQCKEALKQAKK